MQPNRVCVFVFQSQSGAIRGEEPQTPEGDYMDKFQSQSGAIRGRSGLLRRVIRFV